MAMFCLYMAMYSLCMAMYSLYMAVYSLYMAMYSLRWPCVAYTWPCITHGEPPEVMRSVEGDQKRREHNMGGGESCGGVRGANGDGRGGRVRVESKSREKSR